MDDRGLLVLVVARIDEDFEAEKVRRCVFEFFKAIFGDAKRAHVARVESELERV